MFGRLNPFPVTWTIGPNLGTTQLGGDKTVIIWRAPMEAQVVDPGFVAFDTAIAKSATNHAVVNVLNAGTKGTGTALIASATVGKDATQAAGAPAPLAMVSSTAAKLDAGAYLAVQYDEQGSLTLYNAYGSVGVIFGYEN